MSRFIKVFPLNVAKVVLATLTAAVLAVNIVTINKVNEINEDLSDRQNEATWFVFQLVKEYAQFVTEMKVESTNFKSLWLAYDLTWSRFDIIINSKESANFIKEANYHTFFVNQFEHFKRLEKPVELMISGKIDKHILTHRIDLSFQELITFINGNFRLQSPIHEKNRYELERLMLLQKTTTMILVTLFALILIVFWVESRLRVTIHRRDALTGYLNRGALTDDLKNSLLKPHYSLLSIRLLNIEEVNQKYGIDYGDIIIKTASKRVASYLEHDFKLYRYSGSQFIILGKTPEAFQSEHTIKAIKESLEERVILGDMELLMDAAVSQELNIHRSMLLERLTLLSRRKPASAHG
ncbi:GGDEF domain-containing protein [Vibrio sp. E150_011]|uniref:GGDEF domain-containing protein n=1 Tax=Vibrio sp. 10N.261.51.F12 TaxID=3229679 RepID=UPI00354BE848